MIIYLSPVYHLIDIMFQVAQNDYKVNKDPARVAFLFVITNKISVLANLYKICKQEKISDFLKRDFDIPAN